MTQARKALGATLLLLALGLATLVRLAAAHHDTPNPAPNELEDRVSLTNLTAKTDQDDGLNGESEYCIKAKLTHTGHDAVTTEYVNCVSVNWDWMDPKTGMPYDAVQPGSMPLLGAGGYGGGAFNGPAHIECERTEDWTLAVQLTESNSLEIADILKKIGKALQDAKLPVPNLDGGKLIIVGKAADLVGDILNTLFSGEENLGMANPSWGNGEGDPAGEVKKDPTNDPNNTDFGHYKLEAVKNVRKLSENCGTPTSTPTATSTPTPTDITPGDTPTPTPTDITPGVTPTDITPGGIPTPTLTDLTSGDTATPETLPEDGCFGDSHVFSRSVTVAAASWQQLRDATTLINGLAPEPSATGSPDVLTAQRALRELVSAVGRAAPATELDEAQAVTGNVNPGTLASAQQLVTDGDERRDQAFTSDDTQGVLAALAKYQQAFETLAPALHPECSPPEAFGPAKKDTFKCELTTLKEALKLARGRATCLHKCESDVQKGKLSRGACTERCAASNAQTKAIQQYRDKTGKACANAEPPCLAPMLLSERAERLAALADEHSESAFCADNPTPPDGGTAPPVGAFGPVGKDAFKCEKLVGQTLPKILARRAACLQKCEGQAQKGKGMLPRSCPQVCDTDPKLAEAIQKLLATAIDKCASGPACVRDLLAGGPSPGIAAVADRLSEASFCADGPP